MHWARYNGHILRPCYKTVSFFHDKVVAVICSKSYLTAWAHPICSTISLACLMILAPVWQTMPAISIEYHRALKTTGNARVNGGGKNWQIFYEGKIWW